LAEAIAAEEAVAADTAAIAALNEAVTAADEAIVDAGFEAPIALASVDKIAGAENDVYTLSGVIGDDASVFGFGTAGEDAIFVGDAVINTGDIAEDGDDAVLEIFMEQVDGNTEVTIETSVFGSNADTEESQLVVLVGVTATDVSVVDGLLTVA